MSAIFKINNGNGVECEYKVLYYFNKNGNNYLIYSNVDSDEDILAAKYLKEESIFSLIPIENDEEWELVENEWGNYNEKN